ncbi:MAG TPA: carboxypeptidase-like regulatory domain-containing protein, partial [Blastocatellia bacterium]|nr:carboxypeptidase-like regulatory domain-containing protein [Blastocatellia bacterium]
MPKFFKPIILVFIFLFSGVAAFAGPSAAIEGNIFDPRGYIMAGLTVMARNHAAGREYQTYSDDKGAFVFQNVEPGRYVVTTGYPGLERMIGAVDAEAG